jgi:hypothetical protein
MMERYAANRELLQAKRERHFRKSKIFENVRFKSRSGHLSELNKSEWEHVKKRIRSQKKRELWLWIITSIIAVTLGIWAIDYFL